VIGKKQKKKGQKIQYHRDFKTDSKSRKKAKKKSAGRKVK
jgi:hypothetical protein